VQNKIVIKKISEENLSKAGKLTNSIFPDEVTAPSVGLAASFDNKAFKLINSKNSNKFNWFKYWVAVDPKSDKALGTIGIYEEKSDSDDSCWLGWYCVDPEYRGNHLGSMLMDFAVTQAESIGKKYLKVFTSKGESRAAAHHVYKKYGFESLLNGELDDENTLYLQKDLGID